MTGDEAETVAALAAQCVWGARRSWGLIMRYGRLFTPGTEAGGGYPMIPAWAGKNLEWMRAPPQPATDIVAGLGRDIPSRVRDWALTAGRPAGGDRVAPAWVLAELLRFPE